MNQLTRYDCPFDDGWYLEVQWMANAVQMARSFVSPAQAMRMVQAKVEEDLARHLNEEHPGWTMAQLVQMKVERAKQ